MNVQQTDVKGAILAAVAGSPAGERLWSPSQVFTADRASGPDHLGRGTEAAFLAEVVAHRGAETPFCIGILGPAGAGKSSFLARLVGAVARLSTAAEAAGLATPFQGNILVVRVEAEPGIPPEPALMRQVSAALAVGHPGLATDASHAGLDPRLVAREAGERLNESRQRLEAERRTLETLSGRHARLAESVLFDTAGSSIDAYARANRGRIDRALRGFAGGDDTLKAYKEAVHEANDSAGPMARGTSWLRAFWAYRGQGRLIVVAIALLLGAWGVGSLIDNEPKLIEMVRSGGDKMNGLADWLAAHWSWLRVAKAGLELGAVLALAINVLRGLRFMLPVQRGATLLRGDLDQRRREIDRLVAHQTHRVDLLAREVDLAGALAAAAESRLAAAEPAALPLVTPSGSTKAGGEGGDSARGFFATLAAAMAPGAPDRPGSKAALAPARIVVAIDGLDDLTSAEAAAFVQRAGRLLHAPGFVTILAADRNHLATGLAETDPALAKDRLDRLVQIPYALGGDAWNGSATFARALLQGEDASEAPDAAEVPEAAFSTLDRPWTKNERALLEALAPVAGSTPRAVKRFVNLYRVARADPRLADAQAKDLAALAMGLALQAAGSPLDPPTYGGLDDLADRASAAVAATLGSPLGAHESGRGFETARTYGAGR